MKKWIASVSILIFILVSAGCAGSPSGTTDVPESYIQEQIEALEPIRPDSISQNVYNALQNEWDLWNQLSDESKISSSHMPGYCMHDFDSWEECEEFLGFTIPNPLENCSWLEKATYVGMPSDFRDAPNVRTSWYGTEDGHIEWISVDAGYRDGDVRVMISASLYGDKDMASVQITSDSTEDYYSKVAYQANGNVLYRFNIVGEPDEQTQVENTLEQVISSLNDKIVLR